MPSITLTNPVAGTVVAAGLHATNYTALQNLLNGGLDTANWAAGKIFAPSKFMQEGAVAGQYIAWSGSQFQPTTPSVAALDKVVGFVYARATATVDVQNSAAETSIFSQSIGANDMSTNRCLRLTAIGDYLHNNVGTDTLIWRIKFGGVTLYQSNASNLGNVTSANRKPWRMDVTLANLGATNSQMLQAQINSQAMSANTPTTGIGTLAVDNFANGNAGISTLGTVDTTLAQTLDVTMQWSAANLNNSWRLRYALLELV